MRLARLIVVCGLSALAASSAGAQTPGTAPPSLVKSGATPNFLESPLPGSTGAVVADSPDADPNTSLILDNADTLEETQPGQWSGLGNVRVHYKGYTLTSDRVDVDLDKEEALFSGHVVLHAPNGETVEGGPDGTLLLNLRRDTYAILGARSTVPPEALNIGIIQPVYLYGGTISGQPGLIDARGSSFTTCDFLEPHYSFSARQIYVIPEKRLVAKNVTFYRKKQRLFTLPYFFVPLDRRYTRQTLFPQVGQTPDEGYFIKFAFGYALVSSLPGILRLDAMQKKGLGTGFEQNYGLTSAPRKGSGLFSFYRLFDQSTHLENVTGSLTHQQQFGTINLALNTQLQQNSYFAGSSKSRAINTQLNLSRNVGTLNSTLLTTLATNDYGTGISENLTSSFSQTFQPARNEQFQAKLDYSQFVSPSYSGFTGASSRRELDTNLDYTQHSRVVDLEILGTQFTQIGHSNTGSSFSSGVQRLPEIRLVTDATRADWLRQFLPSSTHLALSVGDFLDNYSKTHTQRADFNLNLGTTTKKINSRNSLDLGGSFQQYLYGDNTAQYVLDGRTGYRLQIGKKSSADISYIYLRPYGYTPFQFDQTGNSNLASLAYAYQETNAFRLAVGTGFDFNRTRGEFGVKPTPWQNVAVQSVFSPDAVFRLRTTASYDLNHNTLLDLTNTLRLRAPGGLALDLGARYAPNQHEFSNINGNLDLPFFRDPHEDAGYRLRAIGGYNGLTHKVEYKGLALTRSWHDFEASLIYQDDPMGLRPGSSVTFNFRLKAFPDFEPFAVGQYGQSLDTGLGEVY